MCAVYSLAGFRLEERQIIQCKPVRLVLFARERRLDHVIRTTHELAKPDQGESTYLLPHLVTNATTLKTAVCYDRRVLYRYCYNPIEGTFTAYYTIDGVSSLRQYDGEIP